MSKFSFGYPDDYCLFVGKMVYDEIKRSWNPIPNVFDEKWFWISAIRQRFYECELEAYGCLDSDV